MGPAPEGGQNMRCGRRQGDGAARSVFPRHDGSLRYQRVYWLAPANTGRWNKNPAS